MSHPDQPQLKLPSLALNRWLLGTAALGSASAAQAEVVQIDLVGNEAYVNGTNFVDNTYADFTGDGFAEFSTGSFYFDNRVKGDFGVAGQIGRDYLRALASETFSSSIEYNVGVGSDSTSGGTPKTLRGMIPVTFSDARINGGAMTNAYLEVRATNLDFDSHKIELVRLVFDDAEPEAQFRLSDEQYPLWGNIATSMPLTGTKSRIEKKIAALERQIRQLKKQSTTAGPRLNFSGGKVAILRQIAALERQIAALKRRLGNKAR
jgi:hypothetical protein